MLHNHLSVRVQSCSICAFATWRFVTAIMSASNAIFGIFAAASRIRPSKLLDSILLNGKILLPWRWWWRVPPKHQYVYTKLYTVELQKKVTLFVTETPSTPKRLRTGFPYHCLSHGSLYDLQNFYVKYHDLRDNNREFYVIWICYLYLLISRFSQAGY